MTKNLNILSRVRWVLVNQIEASIFDIECIFGAKCPQLILGAGIPRGEKHRVRVLGIYSKGYNHTNSLVRLACNYIVRYIHTYIIPILEFLPKVLRSGPHLFHLLRFISNGLPVILVQTSESDIFADGASDKERDSCLGYERTSEELHGNSQTRARTATTNDEPSSITKGIDVKMVYLVSYDLKPTLLRDIKPLYEELQHSAAWWHYLDRTWLIETPETESELYQRLKRHLRSTDLLLIMQVRPPYSGQLPVDAWEWIEKLEKDYGFPL